MCQLWCCVQGLKQLWLGRRPGGVGAVGGGGEMGGWCVYLCVESGHVFRGQRQVTSNSNGYTHVCVGWKRVGNEGKVNSATPCLKSLTCLNPSRVGVCCLHVRTGVQDGE
jgi:hypothetical protein